MPKGTQIICGNRILVHPDPLKAEIDLNLSDKSHDWKSLGDALYNRGIGKESTPFEVSNDQFEWLLKHIKTLSN